MANKKAIVLASGGLDSTVLLYDVVSALGPKNTIALSLYYGQKHDKELEYLKWHTDKLGVQSYVEDLSSVFAFNKDSSALLKGSNKELVHESYAEQLKDGKKVSAYVPYRNGLFLSYATCVALQLGASTIYYGAHADDAAGSAYPDCTEEFIKACDEAIKFGTGFEVCLKAPWWNIPKKKIVEYGLKELGMCEDDFAHTWSCYEGGEEPCGTCGTCRDRIIALESNGLHCK